MKGVDTERLAEGDDGRQLIEPRMTRINADERAMVTHLPPRVGLLNLMLLNPPLQMVGYSRACHPARTRRPGWGGKNVLDTRTRRSFVHFHLTNFRPGPCFRRIQGGRAERRLLRANAAEDATIME